MHWPPAGILITLGYAAVLLSYPKLILLKEKRTKIDVAKVLAVFVWGICGLSGLIFYKEYRSVLIPLAGSGFLVWLGLTLYAVFTKDDSVEAENSPIIRIGYIGGFSVLVIGNFFRMMHWPGAHILMITGGIITAITFFYASFVGEDE
ncbi:MAG: hypothetical protein MK078_03900 [Crocinitomicaceae bacterium]|nr:hypothetical protein [Crocinitomicaceae bacterium]